MITISKAKQILGGGYSDEQIMSMLGNLYVFAEVLIDVAETHGSTRQPKVIDSIEKEEENG